MADKNKKDGGKSDELYCPNCSKKNIISRKNERVCEKCGAKLE